MASGRAAGAARRERPASGLVDGRARPGARPGDPTPRRPSSTKLRLELPASLEKALHEGHPWVYRDHVPPGFHAETGSWVEIGAGRVQAWALWDRLSSIALRIYSREQEPDAQWVAERVMEAWKLREPLRRGETGAYRWVFGEGDGLPGIVVDLYGQFAVIATYAPSVLGLLPWVVAALQACTDLRGVVHKTEAGLVVLSGEAPPPGLVVRENGLFFRANLHEGQKTGLFLDHRENRLHVESLCEGKRVLNLFAYSGAFSIYALRGGAARVVSVDQSGGALADAEANLQLNGLDPSRHEIVQADVFEYLERLSDRFDVVICDPPSFAKNRKQQERALEAYARVNRWATRAVTAGGVLCTASCTAQVSPAQFRGAVAQGAARVKRRLAVIRETGHALDHPVAAGHPEGRYLKYLAARVSRRI